MKLWSHFLGIVQVKEFMMNKGKLYIFLWISAAFFMLTVKTYPQTNQIDIEALKKEAPKVFIDCGMCDIDYIRTEITFVNYVRDRKEAQIHILITTQSTGSGGREYTIAFIGQQEFNGINDTHKYYSQQTDTQDEIREGLVKALKIGVMSYVAKTSIASRINISYSAKTDMADKVNKWNYWVFRLSGNGYFNGEKSYKSRSLSSSFDASRVTPDLKISMSLSTSHNRSDYIYTDETIESI